MDATTSTGEGTPPGQPIVPDAIANFVVTGEEALVWTAATHDGMPGLLTLTSDRLAFLPKYGTPTEINVTQQRKALIDDSLLQITAEGRQTTFTGLHAYYARLIACSIVDLEPLDDEMGLHVALFRQKMAARQGAAKKVNRQKVQMQCAQCFGTGRNKKGGPCKNCQGKGYTGGFLGGIDAITGLIKGVLILAVLAVVVVSIIVSLISGH